MTNIFEAGKETVAPKWASFKEAGDSYQGTYVGKILGLIDGYNNEQIVYQLLQDDGEITNVGFGLNKKVIHADMAKVKFGQIVGFKYKGMISVTNKKTGKPVDVKDYGIFQDPKIVNEEWLKDNEGVVSKAANATNSAEADFDNMTDSSDNGDYDDVPFASKDDSEKDGDLTNEDKLAVITKLAKDKLGATDETVKEKVMETTGVAFIPVQYDRIIETLSAM